jgi:hypothetical protein
VTKGKTTDKTQFDQFKAALSTILSVPKSALAKPKKKKSSKK